MKVSVKRGHVAGCNCKKSRCLKKYCECFEGSVFCGPNCKCVECQNLAGSEVCLILQLSCYLTHSLQALKQVKSTSRDRRDRTQRVELSDTDLAEPDTTDLDSPKLPPSSFEGVSATPFKIRSRKFTPNDESIEVKEGSNDSMKEILLPVDGPTETSSSDLESSSNISQPLKKQRVEQDLEQREPVYPFFGPYLPPTTKLIALSCLEYLDGPSLYAMSCVNHLWSQAAMDDALWE
jgi:hypothetical protein